MQLQELKKELERSRHDLHQHQLLLQKREFELDKIHALKKNVESDLIQMHRLKTTHPKKAEAIKKRIDEETEIIGQLKKSLEEIDAELDRLGEEKEAAVTQIKRNLIQEIQIHFPGTAHEYETAENQLKESLTRYHTLIEQQQLLAPLLAIFQQGAHIKTKTSILDFLFGKHPHALLARAIHQASQQAEKILPRIQEPALRQFLESFIHEAKQPGNRSLYEGRFATLAAHFTTLTTHLTDQIHQAQTTTTLQEQKLEDWIDHHCG